jgi:hypothetical protein
MADGGPRKQQRPRKNKRRSSKEEAPVPRIMSFPDTFDRLFYWVRHFMSDTNQVKVPPQLLRTLPVRPWEALNIPDDKLALFFVITESGKTYSAECI